MSGLSQNSGQSTEVEGLVIDLYTRAVRAVDGAGFYVSCGRDTGDCGVRAARARR